MTVETDIKNRPIIERQMIAAGNEIEQLMEYYPCLREICIPWHTDDSLLLSLLPSSKRVATAQL